MAYSLNVFRRAKYGIFTEYLDIFVYDLLEPVIQAAWFFSL